MPKQIRKGNDTNPDILFFETTNYKKEKEKWCKYIGPRKKQSQEPKISRDCKKKTGPQKRLFNCKPPQTKIHNRTTQCCNQNSKELDREIEWCDVNKRHYDKVVQEVVVDRIFSQCHF
jgi:hypothetical protein